MLQGKKIGDFVAGEKGVEMNGLSSINTPSAITFSAVDPKSCTSNGTDPDLDRFRFQSQTRAIPKIITSFVVRPTITAFSSLTVYSTVAKSIVF
jgi:hypothetical protein